ncbi:Non-repetitive/WGA-negative nucleoporin C-terminal-domain-containing protein [Powellomyces hirtus]|nr:Non-repetitive/WGA-negative nucleoporin C-terminal-domain-containing protein [Powellomyces hirtus]
MDSRLYLWNFNDPGSSATTCYADQEQVISTVALVKPLPGVFLEQIDYILVLATRLEVIILGIAFEQKGNPATQLTIFKTDLSIPSDNEHFLQIEGTDDGRIFMRTLSGKLMELQYQANEGWFTRKVRLINHSATALSMVAPTFLRDLGVADPIYLMAVDKSRNVLYTVSHRNDIQLISLGRNGKTFHRIKTIHDAVNQALSGSRHEDNAGIQALYAISAAESQKIQMVAVTSNGDRLFFTIYSTSDRYGLDGSSPPAEPNTLEIVHALPPIQRIVGSTLAVHESLYSNGLLLTATAISQDTDRIYGIAPHGGAMTQQPSKFWIDSYAYHDEEGKVWQISEIPTGSTKPQPILAKRDEPGALLNELATQLETPARCFRLLTNQGLWRLKKLRPIDILCELIATSPDQRSGGFEEFFNTYGAAEACAMCLAVACRHPASESSFKEYAGNNHAHLASAASRLFDDFGGVPSVAQPNQGNFDMSGPLGYALPSPEIAYSGRHDGLALYLSRLLRPVWKNRVVVKEKRLLSNFSPHSLNDLLSALQNLSSFLDERPTFTALPTPESRPGTIEGEAWRAEQESTHNLQELLHISTETINFLLMLVDHNLGSLIEHMPAEQQQDVATITFEDAITSQKGLEITRALMAAYIDKQISEERNMDAVGDELQQICPSICRQNDVILYKGIECIQSARNQPNGEQQALKLREALTLFSRVLPDIPFNKLAEITENLKDLESYDGIVDLVLRWASVQDINDMPPNSYGIPVDPRNLRGSINDPSSLRPQTDFQESGMVRRRRAYEIIFSTIESLESMSQQRSPTSIPSITSSNIPTYASHDQMRAIRRDIIRKALSSDDRFFHEAFYAWLIERNRNEELLQLNTRYLEEYLKQGFEDPARAQLLARFYVQNERYADAARVYRHLAEFPGLDFHTRLGHLNFAVVQARTSLAAERESNRQEMEEILEESDVAQVQMELLEALASDYQERGLSEDAYNHLCDRFLTMNELYNNYAKPCKLYEVQLHALHVSELSHIQHYAETVWTELIRKTREDALGSNRDVFVALREKVREIGRKFHADDNVFPIPFLINKLEQECYQAAQAGRPIPESGWVVQVLRQVNCPFPVMFRAYNDIFDAKLPPWSSPAALTFLLEDIAVLINEWLRERKTPLPPGGITSAPVADVPVQLLDDAIQKYLVTVHDGDARELVGKLQMLAHRIREF